MLIEDDAPELDEIELLIRSSAYKAIARKQEIIVGQKLAELVQDLEAGPTAKVRGYIEGVRACMRLPEQLKGEIQERRKLARKRR